MTPGTNRGAKWGVALGLTLAATSLARPAQACGGLFCSNSSPVNQAAERIVFADNGDGTITAVIEIMYEGPSERFAWALPVPGVPTVGLSSVNALDRLQSQTAPVYTLDTTTDGSCNVVRGGGAVDAAAPFNDFADGGAGVPEEPDVTVVAAGTVGPFDYEVIEVRDGAENPGEAAIEWMAENDYDVSAFGEDVLNAYFAEDMNLLAFRLTKDASAGSIRPVSITYAADASVIPIRPTAVAANEDMGVLVWVLGAGRAVPVNYRTLELNETLINWFDPSSSYGDVVSAAADEAGGHGFVTEMVSRDWDESVFFERSSWQVIQQLTAEDERLELLLQSAARLGQLDGFTDAVRRSVPLRTGVSAEEYTRCPSCYFDAYTTGNAPPSVAVDGGEAAPSVEAGGFERRRFPTLAEDPIAGIDVEGYLAALDELVVQPMSQMDELLTRGNTLSRLFTTLSPDEMTEDPIFDFNSDLGEVSRQHTRERALWCDEDGETHWSVDFDGAVVYGVGGTWPLSVGNGPAAQRILQLGLSGEGEVVEDRSARIAELVTEMTPEPSDAPAPSPDPDPDDPSPSDPGNDTDDDETDDATDDEETDDVEDPSGPTDAGAVVSETSVSEEGCGCSVIGQTGPRVGGWSLLALVGLGLIRRGRYGRRG